MRYVHKTAWRAVYRIEHWRAAMRGRTIGLIAASAVGLFTLPLPVAAQPAQTVFRVGYLATAGTRSKPAYVSFMQGLEKLGYVEGRNLTVEFRSAEGQPDRSRSLAAELVRLGVDVILAAGAEANLQAARQATITTPIVMVAVDYNPLALGYIASLSRPGGNMTGVVLQQVELTAKRLQLLKETVPQVTRIGVFWDAISADQLQAARAAAETLGVTLLPRELRQPPYDFASTFRDITRAKAEALLVLVSPFMAEPERARIPNLAIQHRLPAMFGQRRFVAAGGLMSYGANIAGLFRRAAYHVDRVLQGAQPGELPAEQPAKFDLIINLKTAKQLGVAVPSSILYRADKVIK